MADNGQDAVAAFIAKWKGVHASELATAPTVVIDRCHLRGLPTCTLYDAISERLRCVWLDPLSLDPSREAARVIRTIAAQLAELARRLEQAGGQRSPSTRSAPSPTSRNPDFVPFRHAPRFTARGLWKKRLPQLLDWCADAADGGRLRGRRDGAASPVVRKRPASIRKD